MVITWSPDDNIGAYARQDFAKKGKKKKWHNLGPRPDGFFNLDIRVKEGKLRISVNDKMLVEDDASAFVGTKVCFETGAYTGDVKPQAVEFESLSITAP